MSSDYDCQPPVPDYIPPELHRNAHQPPSLKTTVIVTAAFLGALALASCGSSSHTAANRSPSPPVSVSAPAATRTTQMPTPSPTPTYALFMSAAQIEKLAVGMHFAQGYTITSAQVIEGPVLAPDGASESGRITIQTNSATVGNLSGAFSGPLYFRVFKNKPKFIALCDQLSNCVES